MDEIRNYLIEEINQNEFMSKKRKKVCRVLNHVEYQIIAISTITGHVLISAFASLIGIALGIASSTIGLKVYVINAGIKMHMSIIKKKRKKHDMADVC